ncbi:DUF4189 domain-containing protein [Roseomonas sp. WA12]
MHATVWGRVAGYWRAAAFGLAGVLVLAQGAAAAPDSQQCRIECAATFPERSDNTAVVQTCLARCTARAAALGSANVTGTTAMPMPQTPWTQGPNGRRQTAQVAAVPRELGRQAQRMAQRQAAAVRASGEPGRRGAAAREQAAPAESSPAPVANAAATAPSFFGSLMAAQAAAPGAPGTTTGSSRAPDAGRSSFGAIYLAAAPSRRYGLVVGASDRGVAHRIAESACKGGMGNTCRLAGDFTLRCAAIAHGLRSNGSVVMTAHPSTYTVMVGTTGTGPTQADAERQALAACVERGRDMTCQITEARCAH